MAPEEFIVSRLEVMPVLPLPILNVPSGVAGWKIVKLLVAVGD
jgi:hypothetical protein